MPAPAPRYCRREAHACFAEALTRVEATAGLVDAATAIAMHERPDVQAGVVAERLEAITARIRRGRAGTSLRATLAHVHHVLFEVEGFEGNQLDYYDPHNSYLPSVLARKRGIPISLALVYKAVAEPLGVEVTGIGAPGHFLLRVRDESGPLWIDAFHGGRALDTEEAFRRMEASLGTVVPRSEQLLQPVGHAGWLVRMLRNLEAIHRTRARPRDAAAMAELRRLATLVLPPEEQQGA